MTSLSELPLHWDYSAPDDFYPPESISFLKFMCQKVFDVYEPSQFKPFEYRLIEWLNNLDTEKKQKAFIAILLDLFFIGKKEFESLYRLLANSIMSRWVIDVENIDISHPDVSKNIREKINASWICPITDSLRINSFLKVNNLMAKDVRPDWRSLKRLGDIEKIQKFVRTNKINNLMLIEDFVGSGTQVKNVIKYASECLPRTNILLAPLVVCPDGNGVLKKEVKKYGNVDYRPTLILPNSTKFPKKSDASEPLHLFLHEIFDEIEHRFKFEKKETITGYKSTGGQVVMHSNCPNNTLPIYHQDTDLWVSLFPRVGRQ